MATWSIAESDNGVFYALDAKSGKPRWQFEAGGPIQASPAIKGGLVLFGANDHNLYALNRHNGKKLWNFKSSSFCNQAPPVIQGNRVFAASWADWVWCLELETGKPVWKSFIPVSIEAVSWYKDQLWIRSPYLLVKLDPEKGSWLQIAEASYGYGGMAFAGEQDLPVRGSWPIRNRRSYFDFDNRGNKTATGKDDGNPGWHRHAHSGTSPRIGEPQVGNWRIFGKNVTRHDENAGQSGPRLDGHSPRTG